MDSATVSQLTPFVVIAISVGSAIFLKIADIIWQAVSCGKSKTDAKIDRVEKEIYEEIDRVDRSTKEALKEINHNLSSIKSILDTSSGIERPASICRGYIDSRYLAHMEKQTEIMNAQTVILNKILENSYAKHS